MRAVGLWRYPVKGLLGEALDRAAFDDRGLRGDRAWAVVGADRKIGSGKTTRRFRRMPDLFAMAACTADDGDVVVSGDGWAGSVRDPATARRVSEVVGEVVTLEQESSVRHHDEGGVHLVTTASLRHLDGIDVRRLRPNVLLDAAGEGPVEDGWVGCEVDVGSVTLRVTGRMPRCAMVAMQQADLELDPSILSTIHRTNAGHLGVVAEVARAGTIELP